MQRPLLRPTRPRFPPSPLLLLLRSRHNVAAMLLRARLWHVPLSQHGHLRIWSFRLVPAVRSPIKSAWSGGSCGMPRQQSSTGCFHHDLLRSPCRALTWICVPPLAASLLTACRPQSDNAQCGSIFRWSNHMRPSDGCRPRLRSNRCCAAPRLEARTVLTMWMCRVRCDQYGAQQVYRSTRIHDHVSEEVVSRLGVWAIQTLLPELGLFSRRQQTQSIAPRLTLSRRV